MKIYINDKKEALNVDIITEKLQIDNTYVLNINLNDTTISVEKLNDIFTDIQSITAVRTDLNGEEHSVTFTEYTQVDRIQRKVTDEIDIMSITLIKPTT